MSKLTKHCFDPWNYVEFRPDGKISPCCNQASSVAPVAVNISQLRNNQAFRSLRQSLFDGELDDHCSNCHLRETISVDEFRSGFYQKFSAEQPVLEPADSVEMLRIDITERCNLRCTYCAVSQPDYRGIHDGSESGVLGGREFPFASLQALIPLLSRSKDRIQLIAMNGHGETTFYPDWELICAQLLDNGHPLTVISNFAKEFSDGEIDVLARFKSITISMDAASNEVLKTVRRKVTLGSIVSNITRIRIRALALGNPPPEFDILSGIFDKNVDCIEDLARFAVTLQFTGITFWRLLKYPDVGDIGDVKPIDQLPHEAIKYAIAKADSAADILRKHGLRVVFISNFIENIRANLNDLNHLSLVAWAKQADHSIHIALTYTPPVLANAAEDVGLFIAMKSQDNFYQPLAAESVGQWQPVSAINQVTPFLQTKDIPQTFDLVLPKIADDLIKPAILYIAIGKDIESVLAGQRHLSINVAK